MYVAGYSRDDIAQKLDRSLLSVKYKLDFLISQDPSLKRKHSSGGSVQRDGTQSPST